MDFVEEQGLVAILQDVNRNLEGGIRYFENWAPGTTLSATMNIVLTQILRAGERLGSGLQGEQSPELQRQLAAYRCHLEHLRDLLPDVYRVLLKEKADLEVERGRLQAAATWADSSRQTY